MSPEVPAEPEEEPEEVPAEAPVESEEVPVETPAEPEKAPADEDEASEDDPQETPAEPEEAPVDEPQETPEETPTEPEKVPTETPEEELEKVPTESEEILEEAPDEGQEPLRADDTGRNREADGPKGQVDPKESETLKELQEKIDAEKDQKKKAELQKQYNETYYKEVVAAGGEKLDESILGRFTDKERTEQFYDLQAQYEELQKKASEGKLSKKDVEDFNRALGAFQPPRALSQGEKDALDSLHESPYIPGVENPSPEAKGIFTDYAILKNALETAINPEGTAEEALQEALENNEAALKRILEKEDLSGVTLADLKAAFVEKRNALVKGIQDGTISPLYTQGEGPEIQLFPYKDGKPADPLKEDEDSYYIPDNTSLNLMVQVNKDKDAEGSFTVTIKPLDVYAGVDVKRAIVDNLHFLNHSQSLPKIVKNEDGTYSFTTDKEFGIAQLHFNMPGFTAAFHTGFELTIQAGEKTVTKKFLITKKGYQDEADLNGIGSDNPQKPKAEDGGATEDHKIVEETDKVFNIYNLLKKSNGYIDDVIVNSPNGQALPLSSVEITLTLPEYNGKFAELIQGYGLPYEDLGNGKFRLSLALKDLGGNLKTDEEGNLLYNGKALEAAELKDVILEQAGQKVYIDADGEKHNVTTEIYVITEGETFKVQNNVLYKKNDQDEYVALGQFQKGKLEVVEDGTKTTYEWKDGKLISYTGTQTVYEGNAANKKDENDKLVADPTVTPTPQGEGNVIVTTEDRKSYGGTLVKDGIFDAKGTVQKGDYEGKTQAAVDDTGEFVPMGNDAVVNKEKKTVTIDGETYRLVENAVFNTIDGKPGYLISGFTYQEGYALVDKYGRKMDVTVTKEGTDFTFSKEGETDRKSSDKDLSITTDEVFVDIQNNVVKGYESVRGQYYYDGNKFVAVKDGDTVKGNTLYQNYDSMDLTHKVEESYKNGEETTVLDGKNRLSGSANPEDYVKVDGILYVKKGDYYVGNGADGSLAILSQDPIQGVVQRTEEGEILTAEKDIFQAVLKSNFKLKFPGFLAGKDIVYNLHADVKAKYLAPVIGKDGKPVEDENGNIQYEERSIFKGEDGKEAETKTVDRYFTFKLREKAQANFFKNPPREFANRPDYNFFNIFYREASDRERDQYVKDLLTLKAKEGEKTEAEKDQLLLLDKIQKALGSLYQGAQFELQNGELVITRKGEVISLDRALIWEVGFNNPEGVLFPEEDGNIVIDDTHMDNRLVYDEIILNDTKANWQAAKDEWDTAEKDKLAEDSTYKVQKFAGSDQYFYLDQIDRIILGVNPTFKDKVFTNVGDDFTLTSEEILDALANSDQGTIIKGDQNYTVTRDKNTGQIRIKVFHAFYKEGTETSGGKFLSPVQVAYQEMIQEAIDNDLDATSKDSLKDSFGQIIDKFYTKEQDCYGSLQDQFNHFIDSVDGTAEEQQAKLKEIKTAIQEQLKAFQLIYLDPDKTEYHYDDMSFNAIRFVLKANTTIGGAMDPVKTKKFAISSVIVPDVDIPFTDEFGNPLTNRDMYLNREIEDILKNGMGDGDDHKTINRNDFNRSEEVYREVMAEANRRVNEKSQEDHPGEDKIVIKELVDVLDEKAVGLDKYAPKGGKDLGYQDLSQVKDSEGKPINPWYVDENTTIEDKLAEILTKEELAALKANEELYNKYVNQPIDLAAYYMSKDGANRRFYGNAANYIINEGTQAPGIFGSENNWKKKICRHGIPGHCIHSAGGGGTPDEGGDIGVDENMGNTQSRIEITYSPSSKLPDQEKPKLEKEANKDKVILDDEKQTIDFDIKVSVDKLKKEEKIVADALNNVAEPDYGNYNEKGFFVYKDALVIDILPEIFQLQDASEIQVLVNEEGLKAGGANQNLDMEQFKGKIQTVYVEDIWAYVAELAKTNANRAEVLKAALGDKLIQGKKQQAILAWLPEFEAPHGSKEQIQLTISQLLVDPNLFKDYEGQFGEIYTNEALFGIEGDFLSGKKNTTIEEKEDPKVDKYLQLVDKDGNVVDADKADGWFKGNATIHFGDHFNYKISVYHDNGIFDSGLGTSADKDWKLEDLFASDKGLRPVLRDFVQIPEGTDFVIEYKIGDQYYTEAELKAAVANNEASLAEVTAVLMKAGPKGFPNRTTQDFILPMMIPTLDAKIEDGKVIYIATDGTEKVLGDAKDFFNLKDLTDPEKELIFDNKVEDSNTVTIKLEKERFLKLFKEFLEADGETLITEERPEVTFDIIQHVKGQKDVVVGTLVLNEDNGFEGMLDHLPLFKKQLTVNEDGTVSVTLVKYSYSVQEQDVEGFTVEVEPAAEDELGFVLKAKNTKVPEEPEEPNEPNEPNE
ncbi:MAG: hypothetical protein Q4E76_06640, partial [Tissierellia bacterium]|nr:hypothetical protein [Tissierellia bacterium]